MGTKSDGSKKIIWAVDPFEDSSTIRDRSAQALLALTKGTKASIEPVYVVPPNYYRASLELYLPQNLFKTEVAKSVLEKRLRGYGFSNLKKPVILDEPVFTTTGAVKQLTQYAENIGANVIVVGTHGRKGAKRMFLGSFAESLILSSSIPVITVGAGARPSGAIKHILFPTDLSKQSLREFPKVIDLANETGAKLTVLHTVFSPVPLSSPSARQLKDLTSYLEQVEDEATHRVEMLVQRARAYGVAKCEAEVRISGLPPGDAILKFAKAKGVDLIAMASHSGAVTATFVGSTTRQVVRSSSIPVWILYGKRTLKAISKPNAA